MGMINTVTGPLDTSELGFTLSHEHVLITSAGIPNVYPEFVDREGIIERAVADLRRAYEDGVRTITDVTTMDLGRDVTLLERVSRESGVNIVCSTGIWLDVPRAFWFADPDDVARLFVREVREGIEGTDIKPGIIKVATHTGGVSAAGEIVLRAAARAHLELRIPITTHTYAPERVGDQQIRIFEEEGADLSRVCVGHSDDSLDIQYLIGMLEKGVWLGMDHLTFEYRSGLPTLEERLTTVLALIDAGFQHRIMFGHDWAVEMTLADRTLIAKRDEYNPHGYGFVTRVVIPRLREMGLSQDVIDQIMIENPRRFFEGSR